ncbi:MAG: serine hydrolase [Bacilli bacterium]|nr:serine hydrolase [Bacilli bacterium]
MKKINEIYINKNKFKKNIKFICMGIALGISLLLPVKLKNSNKTINSNISSSKVQDAEVHEYPKVNDKLEEVTEVNIKDDMFSNEEISINNSNFIISERLINEMKKHIKNFGGDCSFLVVNLNDGMSFGYNVDKAYSTASTIKVAFSLYSFKEMDKGNGSLEEQKLYEARFKRDGSGVLKNKSTGTNYSLKDLFYYTIHYSDNVAYYMVHDRFYDATYNDFLKELGCNNLYLNNGAKWGKIDARSMALIWQEIYKYKDESENGKYLFELLTNADYNYIQEGMEKYQSAHKSGWTPRETHDSGIVFANDDYIVVTLNNNNGNYSAKSQLLKTSGFIEKVISEYELYKQETKNKQKTLSK